MKHTVFITGGAGYVGAMLAHQFVQRNDIQKIICIDKEPVPELLEGSAENIKEGVTAELAEKIVFIQSNIADDGWQEEVAMYEPDIVIHTAWQIREMYGNQREQWRWNVEGSDKIFDFAFSQPSVKKLIHFSTVSSYAAYPENTIEHRFKESEGFRESDYLYAIEKAEAEKNLQAQYDQQKKEGKVIPQVFIVRPAAITGPRGRYGRIRFGLQSALSGQLKENLLHKIISKMTSFVPVTKKWCRQFIHEDDVSDIVALLAFSELEGSYEVFNICPPGPVVEGKDMAAAVGKKPIRISPQLIRIVFFIMWHISRGKVPTSTGGWKSYSYPIAVDGSKLTEQYGYQYQHQSKDAFAKKEGRYADLY